MTHKELRWIAALAMVAFLFAAFVISFGLRQHQISECEARGGQVVDHPWYSEHYMDPGCVEAPRDR